MVAPSRTVGHGVATLTGAVLMPGASDVRHSSVSTTGLSDGLGRRSVTFDRELGATLECLNVRPELRAYEQALRAQAAAIAALDDERFVRVRAVEREGTRLVVTSELVIGDRLLDVIDARGAGEAAISGLDAAFGFLLQTLPALSRLHGAGLIHGTLSPARVTLTGTAQVVIGDTIYGAVLPRLHLSRRRLWTEFQIAAPRAAGVVRFDATADVTQASLIALMLTLGRPLDADDPIDILPALVAEAVEVAQIRGGDQLAEAVRGFFTTTLPLDGIRTGVTADQAAKIAGAIASGSLGDDACVSALAEFVRYEAPAAPVPKPRPIALVKTQPAPPVAVPRVADDVEPEVAIDLDVEVAAADEAEVVSDVVPEVVSDVAPQVVSEVVPQIVSEVVPEVLSEVVSEVALEVAPAVTEAAAIPASTTYAAQDPWTWSPRRASEPQAETTMPVVPERLAPPPPPVVFEPPSAPMAAEPVVPKPVVPEVVPERLLSEPVVSERVVSERLIPSPVVSPPVVPANVAPAWIAPVAPEPPPPPPVPFVPKAVPYVPAPVLAEPLVQPTAYVPSPDYRPATIPTPAPPVAARPVTFAPNPYAVAPPPPPRFTPPPAAAPPPAPAAPAPLKLKQEAPVGFAPQRASHSAPAMDYHPVPRGDERVEFPKKMAAAMVIITIVAIIGGKLYMQQEADAKAEGPKPVPAKVTRKADVPNPATPSATGVLAITSIPSGAKVLLNGTAAGETPLRLDGLPPGRHTITLSTDSTTVKRTVKVEAGKELTLDVPVFSGWVAIFAPIVLEVAEGSRGLGSTENGRIMLPPGRHVLTVSNRQLGYSATHTVEIGAGEEARLNLTPTGMVSVNAQPWAEVWVEGTKVGETPIANLEVPLGTREFVFRHPQHGERKVTATVTASPSITISVDFSKSPGH